MRLVSQSLCSCELARQVGFQNLNHTLTIQTRRAFAVAGLSDVDDVVRAVVDV